MRFQWSSMTGDLHPERVEHLQRFLCGKQILDAGCGGGAFVELLARQEFEVTGIDYHEMFLEVARNRPGAQGKYLHGDITSLPFQDKSFDCTYCYDVLEHVDDEKALAELIRVSRSRVIIAVPGTDHGEIGCGMTFRHYQDLTHLRTYDRQTLATLFHTLGQSRFQIFPELAVALQTAAIVHLDHHEVSSPLGALVQRAYHRVLRQLLKLARYKTISSGWLAVIDLAPAEDCGRPQTAPAVVTHP